MKLLSGPAIVVTTICASLRIVTLLKGYALPVKTTFVGGIEIRPPPPPPPPPLPPEPEEVVHWEVLKVQAEVQESEPPVNPCDVQDAPPRLEPSHCSPLLITPSPQPGTVADISTVIAYTKRGPAKKRKRIKNRLRVRVIHPIRSRL